MIRTEIRGIPLELETDNTVFSPSGVDAGTRAMLSEAAFHPDDRVLDLGCGYGVAGILAAKLLGAERVQLCDIQPEAVALSRRNALRNGVPALRIWESDGLESVPGEGFTLILSNPPYHADFAVPKRFIAQSHRRLVPGGRLMMVTNRLDWYKNRLIAVFGGVRIARVDGYYVFTAEKREQMSKPKAKKAGGLSRKLRRKHRPEGGHSE
jgi:16S rRNA (guanine1207-N2)-methyltransferase